MSSQVTWLFSIQWQHRHKTVLVCAVCRVVLLFYQQCRKQHSAYKLCISITVYSVSLSCTDFKTISPHPLFPVPHQCISIKPGRRGHGLCTRLSIFTWWFCIQKTTGCIVCNLTNEAFPFSLSNSNLSFAMSLPPYSPYVPGNYNRILAKLIPHLLSMSLVQNCGP